MATLVEACKLTKHFPLSRTFNEVVHGKRPVVSAALALDFTIAEGESVGILGESGCGKSTTGRLLLKLITPTSGKVLFEDRDLSSLKGSELRSFRQKAQLVFQNPFEALNPRITIYDSLVEPLQNARIPEAEYDERLRTVMQRVGLPDLENYFDRHPHQLSGGQLQRVVLARALILRPKFLVADEPVTMLDVSVRAGILNVMREIREQMRLTAVYISHDFSLVCYLCERTIVMYMGTMVEDGPTAELVRKPQHPYTQALIKAVPSPHVDQSREPLPIIGGMPKVRHPPSGCRFRNRCPYAFARCSEEVPGLKEIALNHKVACHLFENPTKPASSSR